MVLGAFSPLGAASVSAFIYSYHNTPVGNPPFPGFYQVDIEKSDFGNSFDIHWLLPAVQTNGLGVDLTAVGTFVVTQDDDEIVLDITITNTTNSSAQAAIMSFGFGVKSESGELDIEEKNEGIIFDEVKEPKKGKFAGDFKEIDVCIFPSENKCKGGDIKNGLQTGSPHPSDSLSLTFLEDYEGGTISLLAFPIQWQTSTDSFQIPGAPIPEPGTALLVFAGLGAGFWLRKRGANQKP